MSLGIYPVLNPPAREAKFDYVGEVLSIQFDALDKLAAEHGIARPTAFSDTREIPEGFDGSPEELEEALGPWEDWFACSDGIAAFEALANLITNDRGAAGRLQSPDAVAAELRAIASVLAIGEKAGSQFRLEQG